MSEASPAALLGVLADERTTTALTDSVVEVARAIFGAKAASIVLLDQSRTHLVFEAVAGEGAEELLGSSYPADQGIGGYVVSTGETTVVDDVRTDPRFARDVAEGSGFVPDGIMATPLRHEGEPIGVLSVLDRPEKPHFEHSEADLLFRFAEQAALAISLLRAARHARKVLDGATSYTDPVGAVARLGATIESLEGRKRREAVSMIASLDAILRSD